MFLREDTAGAAKAIQQLSAIVGKLKSVLDMTLAQEETVLAPLLGQVNLVLNQLVYIASFHSRCDL